MNVNSQNTQITGKSRLVFLLKMPIDKLLGVCYNGNNAPLGRRRRGEKARVSSRPSQPYPPPRQPPEYGNTKPFPEWSWWSEPSPAPCPAWHK